MSIKISCPLCKLNLPDKPCENKSCDWFINGQDYNNCFWVISHVLSMYSCNLSIEEIADLEGLNTEEVSDILENALTKLRNEMKRISKPA